MNIKRKIFECATDTFVNVLGLTKASKVTCNIADKVAPVYHVKKQDKTYIFFCPNELTRWRAETLFSKEPETIDWIDSFSEGDVLFDVGANVGLYTIYAAKRNVRVIAFEPESQNFALINRNVFLNRVADNVTCLNIALSDHDQLETLFLPEFRGGSALNNIGKPVDWQHEEFMPRFKQGVLAFSLDSFLEHFPDSFPNHLKIDVDGIEARIIQGGSKTLRDSRLKSLSIEINEKLPEDLETVRKIEATGLHLKDKRHSEMVAAGEFEHVYNYVFCR